MKDDIGAPVLLTEAKVKKIARWEDSFRKIAGKAADGPVAAKKLYELQPEDLLAVLDKMQVTPEEAVQEEWAGPLMDRAPQLFQTDRSVWADAEVAGYHGLPCEAAQTLTCFEKLLAAIAVGEPDTEPIRRDLKTIIAQREEAVPLRRYDDTVKEEYIRYYDRPEVLEKASEAEILLYVLYVDELCARKNVTALQAKAYACYGGNRAYACSWTRARDLLMELMQLDDAPGYANSLGYIYYYGRTNNGRPEYARAFYYFSIGAAGGMIESRYKIADMFRGGYGVPKNERIANRLINELYAENLPLMMDQVWDCKFADIALRLGLIHRDGTGTEKMPLAALFFLLQARFAIRRRREAAQYYGDEEVEKNIERALESVLPPGLDEKHLPAQAPRTPREAVSLIPLRQEDYFEMKIRLKEKDPQAVTVCRKSERDPKHSLPMFLTLPEALWCGVTDKLQFTAANLKLQGGERSAGGTTVTVRFDRIEEDGFYYGASFRARISAEWSLKVPKG